MSTAEAKILEARAIQYRDYPAELKAAVIAAIEANGGNVLATARLFNLPRDTVNYWWNKSDRFRFVEIEQISRTNLADKLENIAHSTADSLSAHDLSIVSFRDKGAVLNAVIGNMQLLRGEPTTISATTSTDEDRKSKVSEMLARIEARAIDVTPADPKQIEGKSGSCVQQLSGHK